MLSQCAVTYLLFPSPLHFVFSTRTAYTLLFHMHTLHLAVSEAHPPPCCTFWLHLPLSIFWVHVCLCLLRFFYCLNRHTA
eukprot:JP438871.1.p2 GENE.JP438871.1~~JP438871.1.p2  ORF type:complete len:80 (+),score=0.82 JP438871.1:172-411(+)